MGRGGSSRSGALSFPMVIDGREELLVVVPAPAELAALSEAERAVTVAAAAGRCNEAIARARCVSVRTVANQLASAFRKLGVSSRAELAAHLASPRVTRLPRAAARPRARRRRAASAG